MHMNKLAIGTALALVIAVAVGRAEGATSAFEGTLSGTGISVEMDTNGDGLQGGVLTGITVGTQGQFDFQSYIEFSPPRLSPDCPIGTGELPLLLNRLTLSQSSTGDQIVGQIDSALTCVDPDTGTFTLSGSATITGGTGQFAGATGSCELNQTGAVLVHSGNRVFIRLSGPFKGTITTTP